MPAANDLGNSLSVGVIGAGQLALMMAESAEPLGLELSLLASSADDSAVALFSAVSFGRALDEAAVVAFGAGLSAVTVDHEVVSLEALQRLEASGVYVAPSSESLLFAVDKAFQRTRAQAAGIAVPDFVVVSDIADPAIESFLAQHPEGVVVKSARGGYDGRGVQVIPRGVDPRPALANFLGAGTVVLEAKVDLLSEVAVLVATGRNGHAVCYPVVDTVQRDGICVEVNYPSSLSDEQVLSAQKLAATVASMVGAVGVLAVEIFVTPEGLLLNEVATRPHNSGHWTIEGTSVSQFENHLRAVAGLAVLEPQPVAPFVTMVNVLGGDAPGDAKAARAVPGAHVHDYGKEWRPGRKLGHVTTLGDNKEDVLERAWHSALILGTPR